MACIEPILRVDSRKVKGKFKHLMSVFRNIPFIEELFHTIFPYTKAQFSNFLKELPYQK